MVGDAQTEPVEDPICIFAPRDRHGRRADRVLKDQIPPNDPCHQFPHRCVGISIGAARDWDHRRKLGITQAGKCAAHSCDNEGEHHGRTRTIRDCRGSSHEQTRADDCSNTQHDQVNRTEGTFEAMFPDFLRLGHEPLQRFFCK